MISSVQENLKMSSRCQLLAEVVPDDTAGHKTKQMPPLGLAKPCSSLLS